MGLGVAAGLNSCIRGLIRGRQDLRPRHCYSMYSLVSCVLCIPWFIFSEGGPDDRVSDDLGGNGPVSVWLLLHHAVGGWTVARKCSYRF